MSGFEDDLLAELRLIRAALERLSSRPSDEPHRDAGPMWQCGHRHLSRRQAVECQQREARPILVPGRLPTDGIAAGTRPIEATAVIGAPPELTIEI